jgi:predicted DsbA family dithiol-disulfide isomerase
MDAIEVYADVRCPFAHVGIRRVHERRVAAGAPPMRVRAWPLELVNGAPMDGAAIAHKVEVLRDQVAPDLFGGFDPAAWPTSSLGAMELTSAAYALGDAAGEAVALAVRDAMWEEGRDIADPAVLAELAVAHGVELPAAGAHEVVEAEWREGEARRVVGSPQYFIGDHDFFCPGLDIRSDGTGLHIARDAATFAAFLDEAFA